MKCPGQDSRFWKLDAIFDVKCPQCGHLIEFFKDDTKRKCPNCQKEVPNPQMDFGCAAYCPYAEHCLGSLPSDKVADGKLKALKAKMLRKIKDEINSDSKKMAFATRFLELCEELGKKEGVSLGPLLMASFLACLKTTSEKKFDPLTNLSELDAEEEAINDAIEIFKNFNDQEDNEKVAEAKVMIDSLKIAKLEDNKKVLKEISSGLLTDAAQDFVRTVIS